MNKISGIFESKFDTDKFNAYLNAREENIIFTIGKQKEN